MGKKKNKHLEHYYRDHGQWRPIYVKVLESEAFLSLSFKARCLLMLLQQHEYPNRNGQLGMSEKRAAKLLRCAPNTASKAFEELIDRGFIIRSFDGDYTRGMASEWIITYLPYQGREPTNEWEEWPKK